MIKELNKYSEALTAYRNQGGLPQGKVKNALADIYEDNWENNKRWGSSKINRSCPSCISDMMKSLCAEFEKNLKSHKFPKKVEITLDVNAEPLESESNIEIVEDVDSMKWGELRKYATEKGINIKGKKKADILAELKEL